MINEIQNCSNVLLAINSVKTHKNKATIDIKASAVPKSKILEANLAIANTYTPTNENLRPDLIQRTIAPVNTDLTDLIKQKAEDEIANSPECTVYFIWSDAYDNIQVRFSEVVKEELYKAGISEAEVNDAFVASNGIPNNIPCYYVGNLKINHHLKELELSSKLSDDCFFDFYDTEFETWKNAELIDSEIINEIMFNPRYIKITDIYHYGHLCYAVTLTTNKEKFITDRVAQYLSTTINIFTQELYSNKSSEKKIENLQSIVHPDYLLSNDSLKEETPCLSAESLLNRLDFAPNGMKYNLLVQSNPRYREDTL